MERCVFDRSETTTQYQGCLSEAPQDINNKEATEFIEVDKQAGVLLLYSDVVMASLVDCYIEWPRIPDRSEVSLMVNGGSVFYAFGSIPYIYGIGLKTSEQNMQLSDDMLDRHVRWFSRFADLLVRTCYKQQWYKDIILGFKLESQQYIKSFFTMLANIAFCIQKYEGDERVKLLSTFKELLQFEIDRDYSDEINKQDEIKKYIDNLISEQKKEQESERLLQQELQVIPEETEVICDEQIDTSTQQDVQNPQEQDNTD